MADHNEKKVENETKPQEEKKKLPQLGALEDDDEFEVSTTKAIGHRSRGDTITLPLVNQLLCLKG